MLSSRSLKSIFQLHLVSTLILLGLSILNQIVIYPLFDEINLQFFEDFHLVYIIRFGILVSIFMIIEIITAVNMTIRVGDFDLHSLLRSGLIIIISIWVVSILFEIPNQWILREGYNKNALQTISYVNLFRIIGWSIRAYIVIKMIPFFYNYEQMIREREALR